MKQPHRFTVDFGDAELLRYLREEANARGMSASDLVRDMVKEARLRDSSIIDEMTHAVLDLAVTIDPDGQADPAEDARAEVPLSALAGLLNSAPAAEGIHRALTALWVQWRLRSE